MNRGTWLYFLLLDISLTSYNRPSMPHGHIWDKKSFSIYHFGINPIACDIPYLLDYYKNCMKTCGKCESDDEDKDQNEETEGIVKLLWQCTRVDCFQLSHDVLFPTFRYMCMAWRITQTFLKIDICYTSLHQIIVISALIVATVFWLIHSNLSNI